jgi:GGDEF domain-containing protein
MQQADLEAQVMRLLSYRFTGAVRATDPTAQVDRRELLVILPGLTCPEDALHAAEGVVRCLRHPLSVANRVLVPGVNAGVAVSGAHGASASKLMDVARQSILEARRRPGKGAFMAQWKLSARMLGGLGRKPHDEKITERRRGDSRNWTGPRTER